MITPELEKMLLNGKAKNKIHWTAFGMFTQIQIPTDSFIVIHKIYWNGFFNSQKENIFNQSWKQFFQYNEYQVKIQSDKESPMYYQFRNEINFNYFGDPATNPLRLLNANISDAQYDDYILMMPKKQQQIDTFITAYDYLNFTISRNDLLPSAVNFGLVNAKANEKQTPFGVDGQLVLLQLTMTGTGGTTETINPPSPLVTNAPLNSDNVTNYAQILDKPNGAGDNGSFLTNPLATFRLKYSDYVTNPLMGIEYCIIQKNEAGKLSSL